MRAMKYIFLVNPAAGKGRSDKELLPEVHPFLKARGLDYEIHRTLSEGDIISYVRQRAAGGEPVRFVACGGDGTLNNTLRGMMGFPNAELAVMPYGSGNDFVRNFTNKEAFLDLEKQLNGRV